MTNPLASSIQQRVDRPTARTAKVVDVTGTTVTIEIQGGTVVADGYLSSYAPSVDDIVRVESDGNTWLILGDIVGH